MTNLISQSSRHPRVPYGKGAEDTGKVVDALHQAREDGIDMGGLLGAPRVATRKLVGRDGGGAAQMLTAFSERAVDLTQLLHISTVLSHCVFTRNVPCL